MDKSETISDDKIQQSIEENTTEELPLYSESIEPELIDENKDESFEASKIDQVLTKLNNLQISVDSIQKVISPSDSYAR